MVNTIMSGAGPQLPFAPRADSGPLRDENIRAAEQMAQAARPSNAGDSKGEVKAEVKTDSATGDSIYHLTKDGLAALNIEEINLTKTFNRWELHYVKDLQEFTAESGYALVIVGESNPRQMYVYFDKKFLKEVVTVSAADGKAEEKEEKLASIKINFPAGQLDPPRQFEPTAQNICKFDLEIDKHLKTFQKRFPELRFKNNLLSHTSFAGKKGEHQYFVKRAAKLRNEGDRDFAEAKAQEKNPELVAREVLFSELARLIATFAGAKQKPPESSIGVDKTGAYYVVSDYLNFTNLAELIENSSASHIAAVNNGELTDVAMNVAKATILGDDDAGYHNYGVVSLPATSQNVEPPKEYKSTTQKHAARYHNNNDARFAIFGFDRGRAGTDKYPKEYGFDPEPTPADIGRLPMHPVLQEKRGGYLPSNGYVDVIVGHRVNYKSVFLNEASISSPYLRAETNYTFLIAKIIAGPIAAALTDVVLDQYPDRQKLTEYYNKRVDTLFERALDAIPPALPQGIDFKEWPAAGIFRNFSKAIAEDAEYRNSLVQEYTKILTAYTYKGRALFSAPKAAEVIQQAFARVIAAVKEKENNPADAKSAESAKKPTEAAGASVPGAVTPKKPAEVSSQAAGATAPANPIEVKSQASEAVSPSCGDQLKAMFTRFFKSCCCCCGPICQCMGKAISNCQTSSTIKQFSVEGVPLVEAKEEQKAIARGDASLAAAPAEPPTAPQPGFQ